MKSRYFVFCVDDDKGVVIKRLVELLQRLSEEIFGEKLALGVDEPLSLSQFRTRTLPLSGSGIESGFESGAVAATQFGNPVSPFPPDLSSNCVETFLSEGIKLERLSLG